MNLEKWLLVIVLALPSMGNAQAPAPKNNDVKPGKDRSDFLFEALDTPIPREIKAGAYPLSALMELLTDMVSPPGYKDDPSKEVTIMVNTEEFTRSTGAEFRADIIEVSLPRLRGVPLRTALQTICKAPHFEAEFLIRKNHIEIVPRAYVDKVIRMSPVNPDDEDPRRLENPLVYCNARGDALTQIIEKIKAQTEASIVLSPAAVSETATKGFTIKLMNVPLDTALETLAIITDLKVVRRANVFIFVTPKVADALKAEAKREAVEEKVQGLENRLGGIDQKLDELDKKLDELNKPGADKKKAVPPPG